MKNIGYTILTGMALLSVTLSAKEFGPELRYDADFALSMDFLKKDSYENQRLESMNDPLTKFCDQLYQRNNLTKVEPSDEPIIPKIVHLIWVGPKTPPAVFELCKENIKKHLPDWECKIWTDADLDSLDLQNREYYDEETNYGAKSDILRYELLYQFGGVYLDIDVVLLQPLDILHHTYEFYACLMPSYKWDVIANGIIASVPGHPILKHCIDTIKDHRDRECIIKRTGPVHFQEAFHDIMKTMPDNKRVIALPKTFFFPLDQEHMGLPKDEVAHLIKPESFAIHYWADSWSD